MKIFNLTEQEKEEWRLKARDLDRLEFTLKYGLDINEMVKDPWYKYYINTFIEDKFK